MLKPIGFGRQGERVANTPFHVLEKWFHRQFRGARLMHVINEMKVRESVQIAQPLREFREYLRRTRAPFRKNRLDGRFLRHDMFASDDTYGRVGDHRDLFIRKASSAAFTSW